MSGDAARLPLLQTLGAALSGPDGTTTRIERPDGNWSPGPRVDSCDVVLWGRPAQVGGASLPRSVLSAAQREVRLRLLRHAGSSAAGSCGIYRLPPRAFGVGLRAQLRRRLLQGAVVEYRTPRARRRLLEEIAGAVGADMALDTLSIGAGGALLVRARTPAGPALLRCGLAGTANDPAAAAAALRVLNGAGVGHAPNLLSAGCLRSLSWSLESFMVGSRPPQLTVDLVEQVAASLAAFPRSPLAPSVDRDFAFVAGCVPGHAATLECWALRLAEQLRALPGVLLHGDLWTGNVLTRRTGELSGLVDWDGWRPDGVPGVDLLHLVATDMRLSARISLGEVYLRRPWTSSMYSAGARDYWDRMDVIPRDALLEAVGAAWWVTQVAGDLRRDPLLAADADWLARNVLSVVRAVAR